MTDKPDRDAIEAKRNDGWSDGGFNRNALAANLQAIMRALHLSKVLLPTMIPVSIGMCYDAIDRRDAENRKLRIERDNAREMEDVHGDNWEAAQAEVERLRKMQHCDDCVHEPEGDDPFPEMCVNCGRYYSDMWRAKA